MSPIDRLIQRLGVPISDTRLLRCALVHRSFINEHPEREPDLESNERLEFLGDSVVNMIAAALLYERFPEHSEGELTVLRTELVKTEALAELARRFELGRYVRLGRGEESSGGRNRDSLLADLFEAVVAAIYLDGGFQAAKSWLEPLFAERLDRIAVEGRRLDYKSALQVRIQAERNVTPRYRTIEVAGPEHRREFTVEVLVDNERLGVGSGHSKQAAAQAAAQEALERLDRARG
ncbi:MAG: ribonuclease III [Chloroflexota bacterium]